MTRAVRVRTAAGTLTEAGWQRQVTDLARAYGWRAFHAPDNRPGRNGRPQALIAGSKGYPDLTLVRRAELIFVELKTDTGRLGEGQQDWLDALQRVGDAITGGAVVESHLWRPRDVAIVTERLARGVGQRRAG